MKEPVEWLAVLNEYESFKYGHDGLVTEQLVKLTFRNVSPSYRVWTYFTDSETGKTRQIGRRKATKKDLRDG